jgi:phytanoyl-CoA hydroxylase
MPYSPKAEVRPDRYRVTREEYVSYQRDGFLVVRGLVPPADMELLEEHAMDLFYGRASVPGVEPPPPNATPEQLTQRFTRVHMLHWVDAVSERFLLHPRVLDVLEALIGPDVLALQTMLFYNPPGKGGQGWHQDAYYITTYPDTLIGAWLAVDNVDEENGCLWFAKSSHWEPIYPGEYSATSFVHADGAFADLDRVENISDLDENINTLTDVAKKYEWVPAPAKPGDVIFAHGHLLHRSHANRSKNRWRRAFVTHYCNARSWVPWNHGNPYEGDTANYFHILARGATHLPFAQPKFGTPCAASKFQKAASAIVAPPRAPEAAGVVSAWDPDDNTWKTTKQPEEVSGKSRKDGNKGDESKDIRGKDAQ